MVKKKQILKSKGKIQAYNNHKLTITDIPLTITLESYLNYLKKLLDNLNSFYNLKLESKSNIEYIDYINNSSSSSISIDIIIDRD